MANTSYSFYQAEYGGRLVSSADFPGFAARARAYIDSVTFDRITDTMLDCDERLSRKLDFAVCAVAELIYEEEERAGKTSETTGSHSESYESNQESRRKKHVVVQTFLGNTGLMYRGIS